MNQKNKHIVYVNRGVANSFDDRIEIHKKWKLFPEIEKSLIEHELGHDNGSVTKKDLKNDMRSFTTFKSTQFLIFLTTPSMWWQLSPFFWSSYDNKVYIDWTALIFWAIVIGGVFLLKWIMHS